MVADTARIEVIRERFAPLIATRLSCYQTAELLYDDGTWNSWPDLPIRIYNDSNSLVSISWSGFDDLWLANDHSLPFAIGDATTRWVENGFTSINHCLGQMIRAVQLGRGEMSLEGQPIEIWTRLFIELDDCWLEVFCALDENDYAIHTTRPIGEFVNCI